MTSNQAQKNLISNEFISSLRRVVRSHARNETDADDILQEVLIKVVKAGDTGGQKSMTGWLYKIVKTTSIDYYRNHRTVALDDNSPSETEHSEQNDDSVREKLSKCVGPLLGQLQADDSLILTKIELNGLAQKALAHEMGVSYSTLKSKVQRARVKLKDQILSCCQVELDLRNKPIDFKQTKNSCC